MISKKQISFVASLQQKKIRKEQRLFVAEGEKICRDLLNSEWTVESLFMTEAFLKNEFQTFGRKINHEIVSEKELEKISALTTPQEVLAVVRIPRLKFESNILLKTLTLVLDDIRDPGNLGTIIRIADWFGIKNIVCSETCADAFNPKTVQATMGSLFRINIFYESLREILKNAKENHVRVYGTLLEGENIYSADLSNEGIIMIGSESHGINKELIPFITSKISIPSFSNAAAQKADSLNAAMAAAIVCSEFRRRV